MLALLAMTVSVIASLVMGLWLCASMEVEEPSIGSQDVRD